MAIMQHTYLVIRLEVLRKVTSDVIAIASIRSADDHKILKVKTQWF